MSEDRIEQLESSSELSEKDVIAVASEAEDNSVCDTPFETGEAAALEEGKSDKHLGMQKEKKLVEKEPILRVVKRDNSGFLQRTFVRLAAVGVGFLIMMIFLQQVAKMPMNSIWKYIEDGTLAVTVSKQDFVKESLLLLCIGLALAPAFKMRFWNIGAQGQVLMGALLTSVAMKYFVDISNSSMIFVMFLLAVLAGGIWAVIPALFKVKLNANETLFTLMMNYVAIQLVDCCVDIWKGKNSGLPQFNTDTRLGWVPAMGDEPYGLIITLAVVLAVLMFFYMRSTKHGYEISIVGESLNTARYAGINTGKVVIRTLFLSGAICGLVGFMYVGVADHSISAATGGSYGFTAIIVAWAAHFNPFGMLAIAFLITFVSLGSLNVVNYVPNLNSSISEIVVGIFLFLLIGCEFFINYKLVWGAKATAKFDKCKESVREKLPKTSEAVKKTSNSIKDAENKVKSVYEKCALAVSDTIACVFEKIAGSISDCFNKLKKKQASESVASESSSNGEAE